MPAVLHTGAQGKNLQSLVNLIANSSAFQLRREVIYDLDALPHIYYPWLKRFDAENDLLEGKLPWAVIEVPDGSFKWSGPSNALYPSGQFNLVLADVDRFPGDQQAGYTDFLNFADGVVADVAEKSDTDDNICITSIVQVNAPGISDEKEWGAVRPFWLTRYEIMWNAIGGEG